MRDFAFSRRLFVATAIAALLPLGLGVGLPAVAGDGSVVATPSAVATATNPDFDTVTFQPLICPTAGDPADDVSPGSTDLVGDATHPPTYFAWDSSYLYFRYRVTRNPTGSKGFDQFSWVILLQVPSGNPFQHQFELGLNGGGADDDFGNTGGQKGDTIEVWKNDPAQNVEFSPLFHDDSELRLFAQRQDYAGPGTANTSPLARIALATDGSSFGGDADYFVDVAFPLSVLIAKGVVSGTSELAGSLFFPATSTTTSSYNKDHLDCPFLPKTDLSITKSVVPSAVAATVTSPVAHTITVRNVGDATAKGLVVRDTAFPAALSNVTAYVSSDDVNVTWTLVTTNPLLLRVQRLPQGKSITVRIESNAAFTCATPAFTNTATAVATNAAEVSAAATLRVDLGVPDGCDNKDNNCDGRIDENNGLCSDGNACNGFETCVAGSCVPGAPPNCDDGNACTDDACNSATGCVHVNATAGTPCSDGNGCTQGDTCLSGACLSGSPVVCVPASDCRVPGVCDPSSGHCSNPSKADGVGCNDGNACTQLDTCLSGACIGASPVVCTPSDACHVAGTCDPSTGACSNPNIADGSTCSDGDMCTTADACSTGVCVGGPPLAPDCKDPKTGGFYRWLCDGPKPEDELTLADVACVNDWSVFASVSSIDDLCRILSPDPSDDVCLQAEAQLMAALLNLCKGRLTLEQTISSACSDHTSVWQSLIDANTLLANPARTTEDCTTAQCESQELNDIKPLGSTFLYVNRVGNIVRVNWLLPPAAPGLAAPSGYSVWRRPRGVGSFALISTQPDLTFDDTQAIPGTDFEYQVTVNR